MVKKIIYFINPISGAKSKTKFLENIKNRTTQENISFEILPTNAEANYNFLRKKISDEKITDIVICGGDGTVNQIANALLGIKVNIGIIPLGSGNGLAFAAKIPKQADKALEVIFNGKAVEIDSYFINKKFSCMLCGLGFDAQVAHDFAKQKKRGLATYIRQSAKNFLSAKSYPFKLLENEKALETDAFFISIANSNQFGNNFTIAPQASLYDGLLDIVIVNKSNKMKMVWNLITQIRNGKIQPYENKKFQQTNIGYFQTKKIRIENPQLAPLHIDGDPASTAPVFEIEIIEKAFRLLMPK